MSKRRKIFWLVAAALALAAVLLVAARNAEPTYGGRSLTSWLAQCSSPLDQTQRLAQAQAAVRAIGAPKALPTLLRLVQTKDKGLKGWVVQRLEDHPTRFVHRRSMYEQQALNRGENLPPEKGIILHWQSAIECQLEGIDGFEVLGTNCAPAVGALTRLLDDKDLAFVAARCLSSIGKPAETALCQCLTNADWQVRRWSVGSLAEVTDDVEIYINRIKPCLRDGESSVRFAAVQAIAAQHETPELAVPLLIAALQDTQDVAPHAAEGLAGFGTNALSAWPALTNLLNSRREDQVLAALKALPAIDAAKAFPLLTNAVINGSPPVMGTALRELKPMAPELALSMTLAELRSNNPQRQLVAVGLAETYGMDAPGIPEALKIAAASSDQNIAERAANVMRGMLYQLRDKHGRVVLIPNEPAFKGKPLGEWLVMWQDDSNLSTNAVQALRHMGTNLVPALVARLCYRDPIFNLDDYDVSMGAARALIALGDDAKPALPALATLLDTGNRDEALRAMISTLGMGTNAFPCLLQGLTNAFPDVRGQASGFITEWGAQFPEQRRQAVPHVIKLLSDPDPDVRRRASDDLLQLDPQAAAKLGIKLERRVHGADGRVQPE
jgi:HEAT repeat protein